MNKKHLQIYLYIISLVIFFLFINCQNNKLFKNQSLQLKEAQKIIRLLEELPNLQSTSGYDYLESGHLNGQSFNQIPNDSIADLTKLLEEFQINQEQYNTLVEYLQKKKVQQLIQQEEKILFVMNSFNGDFNGYLFSKTVENTVTPPITIEDFRIKTVSSIESNWFEVYGSW